MGRTLTSHVTSSHQGPESYTCLHGFTSFRLSFLSCDPRAFSLLEYQASPSHILFDTTVVKVNLEMTEKVVPNTFSEVVLLNIFICAFEPILLSPHFSHLHTFIKKLWVTLTLNNINCMRYCAPLCDVNLNSFPPLVL